MGQLTSGNFSANGSSDVIVASSFTLLLGNETNNSFGGGTVSILVKQDGKNDWTTDSTYTTGTVKSSIDFVGGLQVKLSMAGSTTPNLDYTIIHE